MTTMISLSPDVKEACPPVAAISPWCADAFRQSSIEGRITGLYQHAVNWQDMAGRLFCLVDSRMGSVPFGISVDVPEGFSFLDCGLQTGDAVAVTTVALNFGDGVFSLDLSGATVQPAPGIRLLKTADSIHEAMSILQSSVSKGGLFDYVIGNATSRDCDPFMEAISKRLNTLRSGFRIGPQDEVIDAARGLVGLGMGLTPSGDDVLVGLLAGMSSLGNENALKMITTALSGQVKGRTTDVGAAYLENAMEGRFSERLTDYVNAVVEGGNILRATERLLAFGASSGQDCAVGVLSALRWNREKKER